MEEIEKMSKEEREIEKPYEIKKKAKNTNAIPNA